MLTVSTPSAESLLEMRGITKAFPEVQALGAGKSTLIKILSGVYQADRGVVTKQNVDQVDFTLERGPVGWKP
jgi:ABC-type sugar transport system ATPase subunit